MYQQMGKNLVKFEVTNFNRLGVAAFQRFLKKITMINRLNVAGLFYKHSPSF